MSNFNWRSVIWPLVAIAGTATIAVSVYSLSNTSYRSNTRNRRTSPTSRTTQDNTDIFSTDDENDENSETDSQIGSDNSEHVQDIDENNTAVSSDLQILRTLDRNFLLFVFSLLFMAIVAFVAILLTFTRDEVHTATELPMFSPLMWLSVGVLTAAGLELAVGRSREEIEMKNFPPVNDDMLDDIALNQQEDYIHEYRDIPESIPHSTVQDDMIELKAPASSEKDAVIHMADQYFEEQKYQLSAECLQSAIDNISTLQMDADTLWRLARALHYHLISTKANKNEQKLLAEQGFKAAEDAVRANADSAPAHKWLAVALTTITPWRHISDRHDDEAKIYYHLKTAIDLDPVDAQSCHLLGRWCLNYAECTWLERAAKASAATIVKDSTDVPPPPAATFEDALTHFLEAEHLKPAQWKANLFMLATTCALLERLDESEQWLKMAVELPVLSMEDEEIQKEIFKFSRQKGVSLVNDNE